MVIGRGVIGITANGKPRRGGTKLIGDVAFSNFKWYLTQQKEMIFVTDFTGNLEHKA